MTWQSVKMLRRSNAAFGVSPFQQSRRDIVDRGKLFDVPTYRWLPAKGTPEADYSAVMLEADAMPERVAAGAGRP